MAGKTGRVIYGDLPRDMLSIAFVNTEDGKWYRLMTWQSYNKTIQWRGPWYFTRWIQHRK